MIHNYSNYEIFGHILQQEEKEMKTFNNPALYGRTKFTHPYSYDPILQWRGGEGTPNDSCWSDRLLQWDYDKTRQLLKKHFPKQSGDYWNSGDSQSIEAFLREWHENPKLVLLEVWEYCNASSGFPVWLFIYNTNIIKEVVSND